MVICANFVIPTAARSTEVERARFCSGRSQYAAIVDYPLWNTASTQLLLPRGTPGRHTRVIGHTNSTRHVIWEYSRLILDQIQDEARRSFRTARCAPTTAALQSCQVNVPLDLCSVRIEACSLAGLKVRPVSRRSIRILRLTVDGTGQSRVCICALRSQVRT